MIVKEDIIEILEKQDFMISGQDLGDVVIFMRHLGISVQDTNERLGVGRYFKYHLVGHCLKTGGKSKRNPRKESEYLDTLLIKIQESIRDVLRHIRKTDPETWKFVEELGREYEDSLKPWFLGKAYGSKLWTVSSKYAFNGRMSRLIVELIEYLEFIGQCYEEKQ